MSKRTREANRAKAKEAKAKQARFKRPHPDPWKRVPPAGADVDDRGVVRTVLFEPKPEPEPRVVEYPGVLEKPHFTDDQGVVRAVEDDPVGALSAMLRDAGARVTFDGRANVTHPCWRCGTTEKPRELEVIGVYARWLGGNLEPGDKIRRPLCGACQEDTRAGAGAGELGHAEALTDLAEERQLRERLVDICTRTVNALRGPHPTGGMWGWHDLPELAAAAATRTPPPLDLELFAEAFMSVIDEKPGDGEEAYDVRGEVRHRPTVLARLFRRAGVTTVPGVFARVLAVYDVWRAAKAKG